VPPEDQYLPSSSEKGKYGEIGRDLFIFPITNCAGINRVRMKRPRRGRGVLRGKKKKEKLNPLSLSIKRKEPPNRPRRKRQLSSFRKNAVCSLKPLRQSQKGLS